jgi:DNA-binding response OmpR family regulator
VVDLVQLTLNHGLFVVRAASNVAEAQEILSDWHPHLALVDMDHDDSSALLHELVVARRWGPQQTPALGLTRARDLATKLRAFELGVDDIVTTPFSPKELLARALVITRRTNGAYRHIIPTITIDDIEIDVLNRHVRAGGSVVHLSATEQSVLYVLASRTGRVVTRDEILDAIWGADFATGSNVVDRHIRSLRAKLHDDDQHPRFIATVRGEGYRFVPTFSNAGWSARNIDVSSAAR